MSTKTRELTWANVDADNDAEMETFRKQEERKAGERIRRAVKDLQRRGIIDEKGELISKELPADMREDSECDLG